MIDRLRHHGDELVWLLVVTVVSTAVGQIPWVSGVEGVLGFALQGITVLVISVAIYAIWVARPQFDLAWYHGWGAPISGPTVDFPSGEVVEPTIVDLDIRFDSGGLLGHFIATKALSSTREVVISFTPAEGVSVALESQTAGRPLRLSSDDSELILQLADVPDDGLVAKAQVELMFSATYSLTEYRVAFASRPKPRRGRAWLVLFNSRVSILKCYKLK